MTNEELDRARAKEAQHLWVEAEYDAGGAALIAARLAREGWTPPRVDDPDIAEAEKIRGALGLTKIASPILRAGIKRGRELERQEAKPGVVWVKHDGAAYRPAFPGAWVTTRNKIGGYISYSTKIANDCDWSVVTHYAIITPPEDVA
jgi:hypothetical protein